MKPQLSCPRCGTAMNHQADKLREPTTREEAQSARFGGVLIAVFACPNCGRIESLPQPHDD